jgi:hypothetical protein
MFLDREDVQEALQAWADGAPDSRLAVAASNRPDINDFLRSHGVKDAAEHALTVQRAHFASAEEREAAGRSRAEDKCRLVCKRMDPPECFYVCL